MTEMVLGPNDAARLRSKGPLSDRLMSGTAQSTNPTVFGGSPFGRGPVRHHYPDQPPEIGAPHPEAGGGAAWGSSRR